jgi:hypothetical protein
MGIRTCEDFLRLDVVWVSGGSGKLALAAATHAGTSPGMSAYGKMMVVTGN